jgi:hypothetical protein
MVTASSWTVRPLRAASNGTIAWAAWNGSRFGSDATTDPCQIGGRPARFAGRRRAGDGNRGVKRGRLLRHLRRHGCCLKREGSAHPLRYDLSTGTAGSAATRGDGPPPRSRPITPAIPDFVPVFWRLSISIWDNRRGHGVMRPNYCASARISPSTQGPGSRPLVAINLRLIAKRWSQGRLAPDNRRRSRRLCELAHRYRL